MPIEPDRNEQGGARGRLPLIALVAWALFAFGVPRAVQSLNAAKVFSFPLGYLMMALGCFIAMLAIAILSAQRQSRRDARRAAADSESH